jgi:aspartate/methionine/tyrosine aminotransferase
VTRLPPFEIERFFGVHEFAVPYLLCASDVEALSLKDLLAFADDELRALWDDLSLGYTETLGLPLLRSEIAGIYETLEAGDVMAVVGASEALFILMAALVRPGDHVVALWPAYQSLYDLARSQGAEVELIDLRPEDGWALDLDRIAAAMRPSTRAVVVNLPHNPTGMHISESEFDALVELVDRHGATLVCDEVYRGLEHDPAARLPAAADRSPRAVSVGVLSKSYALAGLRVGWLATRDRDLLAAASQVRDYTSLCSPAPSEVLGVIALRAAEALIERSLGIISANLEILDELFAAHPERIQWVRPRAGSIGFPRYLGAEGIDAFNDRLVREQGVLLLPGRVYDYGGGHFRIGFGRTNLPEAVARLDRQLRA